jgi:hypothetical protein
MSDKRRTLKAQKELEETKILVDYLLAHDLSFDLIENFSDYMVRTAKEWYIEQNDN